MRMIGKIKKALRKKAKIWPVNIEEETFLARKYFRYIMLFKIGDSLVNRLEWSDDLYEPESVKCLWREISQRGARHVLDIGANIGFISLSILSRFPGIVIDAFEPGPFQSHILECTIKYNNLSRNLRLHKIALADFNGDTEFFVHSYAGVENGGSGDGFKDTGRAGDASKIVVKARKLDDWWAGNGKPRIHLAKLDTEGSELLALRGGAKFIEECRPTLVLEICPENFKEYAYDSQDISRWLKTHGYQLYTMNDKLIAGDATDDSCTLHDGNYIAIPIEHGIGI
jgi:FkbM family methyltransferase